MRVLITGADGFVARHLIAHLREQNPPDEITALVWDKSPQEAWPSEGPGLRVVPVELRDAEQVRTIIKETRPEVVFHLAAASSVQQSWENPTLIFQTNIFGQLHLLEASRALANAPRIIIASSGEIYGRGAHSGQPIGESAPLRPLSPYALSKATQDLQARQYHDVFGMPTIRLRLFNHTGPGRPSNFVSSDFARQIAEIEAGLRPPLMRVGDLSVARDFSDVRDVIRAWRLAAVSGVAGEAYNVCSGHATRIRDLLEILLGLSEVEIKVEVDPERLRPGEIPVISGDPTRFKEATGWEPAIPLKKTLGDLLNYWRRVLGR